MMKKVGVIILVVAACISGVGVVFIPAAREKARRAKCMAPLQCCIRKASAMYAMDHDGMFPTNIQGLLAYANNVKLYVCPGSGTLPPASLDSCTDWVDYIYISWPTGEKTPAEYPWIYDRRLSHHQGKGINLAPIDGPAFWDEGAQWLQKFANDHPDLKIPMPEDL